MDTLDADVPAGGDQGFVFIDTGNFTGTGPEIRYFFDGGNTIVQGELGGDGDAVVDFEMELIGNITLVAGDFIL